ncbi:MAG: capsid protein [Lachnospiraceae bacterium]
MDKIKTAMRTWLEIKPGIDSGAIHIDQALSFDAHVLRNRIWYRGDPSEIEQFFKAAQTDPVTKSMFWAAVPELPIRKIHLDIPGQIIDRMAGIVVSDFSGFEIKDQQASDLWDEIAKDNKWSKLANDSLVEALVTGDGAYKMSVDPDVSTYPIIEFYGADRATPVYKRGRLQEIIFHTLYISKSKRYRLDEHYGEGYIRSTLLEMNTGAEDREVLLTAIPETEAIKPEIIFTGGMLAVPVQFFKSPQWPGRGASLIAAKTPAFDALDEVVSEWWDAYRKGRVKQFLPEDMFSRDPDTGKVKRPNPFDDMFVFTKTIMSEDGKPLMATYTPGILAEEHAAGYAQALDMALMGIMSPSTLGIDLKKTDNAEAQREKEKATLWTRSKILNGLNEAWPALVKAALAAAANMASKAPKDLEITCTFGEYSSPSFDAQLQSIGTASQWNLLSIESQVDELWGDTKDDAWKATEVQRIKELRGITTVDEPAIGQVPDPAKPVTAAIDASAVEASVPEKVNLNGAQMASLLSIVKSVKIGDLSRSAAINLISSSLPLSAEQAGAIIEESTGGKPNESSAVSKSKASPAGG